MELKSYAVTIRVELGDKGKGANFGEFTFRLRALFPPKCGSKCGAGIVCECWPL